LITIALLGTSGTAFAADRTFFLAVPQATVTYAANPNQTLTFRAFGTITTNGASALSNADVVDYNITLYSDDTQAAYTLTPGNSTFSWSNMTASLFGIYAPLFFDPDNPGPFSEADVISNLQCVLGSPQPCYSFDIGKRSGYTVLGFGEQLNGQPVLDATWSVPRPWAVSSLVLVQPDTLWTALHLYGTLVSGPGRVGPGVPNLIDAAQRYYDANDAASACRALDAVARLAREGNGAASGNGNGNGENNGNADDRDAAQVIAYAHAIQVQIGCPGVCN
jgi:hypothetical protein